VVGWVGWGRATPMDKVHATPPCQILDWPLICDIVELNKAENDLDMHAPISHVLQGSYFTGEVHNLREDIILGHLQCFVLMLLVMITYIVFLQ